MSNKIVQMTHSDYLAHPAFGATDIIKMSRSFAYYHWWKNHAHSTGRALAVGSATHSLLQASLTRGLSFPDEIQIYRDGSSKTKGFDAFQKERKGKYCLDLTEFHLCESMVTAILEDKQAMSFLTGAVAEPTVMGTYLDTDIPVKCRPDYLHMEKGVSINIKTTTDASESGFIYSAKEFQYDFQSAFYIDVLSKEFDRSFDEIHILVEKVEEGEPVPVKIFSFGDDTVGWARSQIAQIMERLPECMKTGVWPKNRSDLETIELPIYARKIVSF